MRVRLALLGMLFLLVACSGDATAPPLGSDEPQYSAASSTSEKQLKRWLMTHDDKIEADLMGSVPDFEQWVKAQTAPVDVYGAIGGTGSFADIETVTLTVLPETLIGTSFSLRLAGTAVVAYDSWAAVDAPGVIQSTANDYGSFTILQRRSFSAYCFAFVEPAGPASEQGKGRGRLAAWVPGGTCTAATTTEYGG